MRFYDFCTDTMSPGTGLFVGAGSALAEGGPASLVIAYGLIGIMLFCTVQALGELAVLYPQAGSFAVYATRFIDPAWGFAMAWNYALSWLVTLPLEIVAASITISYWQGARDVNRAAWVTLFLFLNITINLFGVRGYGEAEFVFSITKVAAVLGFIILGIVIDTGGRPNHHYDLMTQQHMTWHHWCLRTLDDSASSVPPGRPATLYKSQQAPYPP